MKSFLRFNHIGARILFAMIVMVLGYSSAWSQCQPVWNYGPMAITNVTVTQGSTTVFSRTSDHDCVTCPSFTTPITNGAFATGVSGSVQLGKTYNYSLLGCMRYYCQDNNNYPYVYAIWVDLNGDGQFQNATERVASSMVPTLTKLQVLQEHLPFLVLYQLHQ